MQLYVIHWTFQDAEDQLFATNEFCEYLKKNNLNESVDGFELKFMAHTPQNGTGTIICEALNTTSIFNSLKIWRDSYNISFDIRPALTNEELIELNDSKAN